MIHMTTKKWIISAGLFNGLVFGVEWDLEMHYFTTYLGFIRVFCGKLEDFSYPTDIDDIDTKE